MASTTTRLTYDDLKAIPQQREGDRHELIDGELIVTPAPIPVHQIISFNIEYALGRLVRENGHGTVLHAPIDVRFSPHDVLSPDVIFISQERLRIVGPKSINAPPDL